MKDFLNSKVATAITVLIFVAALFGVAVFASRYPQYQVPAMSIIGMLGVAIAGTMKGIAQ